MSKEEVLKNFQDAYGEYVKSDTGIINETFKAAFVRMCLARREALNAGYSDSELDGVAVEVSVLLRLSARIKAKALGVAG